VFTKLYFIADLQFIFYFAAGYFKLLLVAATVVFTALKLFTEKHLFEFEFERLGLNFLKVRKQRTGPDKSGF
jgi:hypothetical protein